MRNLRFFVTAIMLLVSVVARANIFGFDEQGLMVKPNGDVVITYLDAGAELTVWCGSGYCDSSQYDFVDIDSYSDHGCGITTSGAVRCWTWNQTWDMSYPPASPSPLMVATNANSVSVVNASGELWYKLFGGSWANVGAFASNWYWIDGNLEQYCGANTNGVVDHVECFSVVNGQAVVGLSWTSYATINRLAMNNSEVAFDDGSGLVKRVQLTAPHNISTEQWGGNTELAGAGNSFCANMSQAFGTSVIWCNGTLSGSFGVGPGVSVGLAMTTVGNRDCFVATGDYLWAPHGACSP